VRENVGIITYVVKILHF